MISKKYEIGSGEVGTVTIEYGGSSMSFNFIPPHNKDDLDKFVEFIMWEFKYTIVQQFKALGYSGGKMREVERLLIDIALLGDAEQNQKVKKAMELLGLAD